VALRARRGNTAGFNAALDVTLDAGRALQLR